MIDGARNDSTNAGEKFDSGTLHGAVADHSMPLVANVAMNDLWATQGAPLVNRVCRNEVLDREWRVEVAELASRNAG